MAVNFVIESPEFDRIKKESGTFTRDAVKLLWFALNDLSRREGLDFNSAKNTLSPVVLTDAPATGQDNYDGKDSSVLLFTGGTAFNLTGIRNGVSGRLFFLFNLGTGTITIKNESASSDITNRIDTVTGADKTVVTNKGMILIYLNSRWREISLA